MLNLCIFLYLKSVEKCKQMGKICCVGGFVNGSVGKWRRLQLRPLFATQVGVHNVQCLSFFWLILAENAVSESATATADR